jgi:SAM-dependent methyltransferase
VPDAESKPVVRVLDAGAGPLTVVGTLWSGVNLEVTACDALGKEYAIMYDKYEVIPAVRTRAVDFEEVNNVFARDYFDVVNVRNSLDHAYDPMAGIEAMLEVTKPHGAIYMEHNRREAEFEHYAGMHQWNFDYIDDEFVIWSAAARVNVNRELSGRADVTVNVQSFPGAPDFMTVIIRKR